MITPIDEKPLLEKRIRQVVRLSNDVQGKMSIFESSLDGTMVLIMFVIKQDLQ